ncbi:SAM-dependent methyltransferase [Noviherbaspirillum galbum]|uniref:Class I SAM-dependent methyltransferase n=1 Tax=Noviherbaspirillum galbum TaxID=2709383 RepID=A0A6B3SQ58_9BURK|nr:class I SAM-dependent methyltransferase [Noviherbaspirillum galbum]NEX62648.1 class I SAM-dependent methyltransferase [Noviherbaspirillum galbum]
MRARLRRGTSPRRRSLLDAPAIQALLCQIGALAIVIGCAYILAWQGFQVTVAQAILLQSFLAAGLGRLRGMAPWWTAIQFIFPIAVALARAANLPAWIYLAIFAMLLAVFWSTFRTQVPYFPSTASVWDEVESLVPSSQSCRLIDIGCGFGGMALRLARNKPACSVEGIELAPLPWLVSVMRAILSRSRARFRYGDFHALDFGGYDIVFGYLSPAAMPDLWRKAASEMKKGSLLLSNEFSIPGIEPEFMRRCGDGRVLYGWRI